MGACVSRRPPGEIRHQKCLSFGENQILKRNSEQNGGSGAPPTLTRSKILQKHMNLRPAKTFLNFILGLKSSWVVVRCVFVDVLVVFVCGSSLVVTS